MDDNRYATGSTTVVTSADAKRVYTVEGDAGTVSAFDTVRQTLTSVNVGGEPTRLARAGNKVLATLRAERGIAVLVETSEGLALDRIVPTGTEPYGIVASEDGKRVFVALSTQNQVQELDGDTLAVMRTWDIPGEPRWLALHPSGDSLYAGCAFGGGLWHLNLDSGTPTRIPNPVTFGATGNELTPRITGDLAISPDGSQLAIPSLYVDNLTPVDEGDPSDGGVITGGYGSVGFGVSRLNPVVGLVSLNGSGEPQGNVDPMLFAGFATLQQFGNSEPVRSYPSSATYAPDGRSIWVTLEASRSVAVLPTVSRHIDPADEFFADTAASTAGFSIAIPAMIGTGEGPRGVAFTDTETPWVQTFLDRKLASMDTAEVDALLMQGFDGDNSFVDPSITGGTARAGYSLGQATLPPEVELGRKLFYSATGGTMAGVGSGVSCSTCHFDGRNDGVTWNVHGGASGMRNTPSLVGGTSANYPVTWAEQVSSVSEEAQITSQTRMGGSEADVADFAAIQLFVDQQRLPDVPSQDDLAVARGREAYVAAGCDTCHVASDRFVDHQPHRVLDIAVDTPSLRGVAASAPYMHDGSAGTLEAVLMLSDVGAMGDTSALSASQKADLLAYLKSL